MPGGDHPDRAGRYQVLGVLGTGGMGVVREAIDREHGGRVALKSLRRASPERVLRFKHEFRVARDLHHPNLVRLGELFEERGEWFFTMELIRGVELLGYVCGDGAAEPAPTRTSALVGRLSPFDRSLETSDATVEDRPGRAATPSLPRPPCDLARLRATVIQLARGLEALHRAGLVHRDVKPSNLLVDRDGRAVLVDFGIAIEHAEAPAESGNLIGTIAYMAPEQISGGAVGPAADWYAVGALLFVALTGRPPFDGAPEAVMVAKTGRDGPAPSTINPEVPRDLDRLCERLLSLDPAMRPGSEVVLRVLGAEPEPLVATGPAPFVGRDALLADLDVLFTASRAGTVVVTLEGDAGIGKTTLAARAIAGWRAAEPALIVLRGRCHEREAIPYNAIDGVIDELGRELLRLPDDQRARLAGADLTELARLFPTLPSSDEPAAVRDPIAARRRAFAALRELLRRLAARGPLVLVIDDVQWADVDSLAALEALLATPGAPALLLLATARVTAARPWTVPPALAGAVQCRIDGLGADAVAAMASAFGRGDVDLARLVHDTAGNPMLLEQWLSLPGGDGAPPPGALDAVVAARSARLSPPAIAVLEIVAVAGRAVSQAAVAAAAELGPDGFAAAVAELEAARFARRDGTRPSDSIEAFHDRIREHVYAALDPARGRALHGRLAEALIAAGGAPDAIASQLLLAGQRQRAAHHARLAAEAAERALAFERAAALYRMALDSAPDPALSVRLAGALASAGRPEESAGAYLHAATTALVPADRLELRRRGAEQLLAGGYLDRGLDEARAILEETGGGRLPRGDLGAVVALVFNRLRLALRRLRWTPRAEHEVGQEVLTRLDIHWSMSIGLALTDSLRGALFAIRLPILCLPHGEELRIARALCAAASAHAGMGLRGPAQRLLAATSRAADAHGSPLARFYAGFGRLTYEFLVDNDWRAVVARCDQLGALWRDAGRGRGWELDTVEQFGCFADLWLGRYRALDERVAGLARLAADAGNRYQEVGLRAYFASLHTLLGDPDTCEREVGDALARWSDDRPDGNQAYWGLRSRTHAAMYRGDGELAGGTLDPAWKRLGRSLLLRVPAVAAEADAALGGYQINRAALARDPAIRRDRLAAARQVARRLRRSRLPGGKMAYQSLAAGIAHLAGDEVTALRHLRAAAAAFEASGMEALLAATRLRVAGLVGGSEGDALRTAALTWFARERIPDPERTAALLAPGWHPDAH